MRGFTCESGTVGPISLPNAASLSRGMVLSRPPANGRWMRLPLVVEMGDSVRDGAGESVGIGEGAVGELMLLEVAPASLDVIQLGGVFWQPLDGEPGTLGKRAGCQLAGVDRPVIENRDQRPGAFGGAVGGAELVEQGGEVGRALGGLVCTRRRRRTGSKAPSIARFFAWPGAWMRNSVPRRAQQRAR